MNTRSVLIVLIMGILIPFVSIGCDMSETKSNAEKNVDRLYQLLKEGKNKEALDLYSSKFFEEISREKWKSILKRLPEKLGTYQDRTLKKWRVQSGTNTIVRLQYKVNYTNAEATESFTLEGSKNPKIIFHHINSEAFLFDSEKNKSETGENQKKN